MKVTSVDISCLLYQIEFEAETDFYWAKDSTSGDILIHNSNLISSSAKGLLKAYDLETILDALRAKGHISLFCGNRTTGINFNDEVNVYLQENESLADTAARLLIKLIEEGLI